MHGFSGRLSVVYRTGGVGDNLRFPFPSVSFPLPLCPCSATLNAATAYGARGLKHCERPCGPIRGCTHEIRDGFESTGTGIGLPILGSRAERAKNCTFTFFNLGVHRSVDQSTFKPDLCMGGSEAGPNAWNSLPKEVDF